jgi:hypothetical protein
MKISWEELFYILLPCACFLGDSLKFSKLISSKKVQIYKKHQITNFFVENKIKREKYVFESMFLKFFDNFKNKHGILSQKFADEVTKLWPPEEIRRFDGTSRISQTCPLSVFAELLLSEERNLER